MKITIVPIRFRKELLDAIKKVAEDLELPVSTTIKFLLKEILESKKYKKPHKKEGEDL